MSHDGKMKRGKKWYDKRDNEGVLPKGIINDPAKMADVNYYLENKPEEKPKTSKKEK